jgi:hypothetical protein
MSTEFYGYHVIATSAPLNWFCPRLKEITVVTLVEMALESKLLNMCGSNDWNRFVCLFLFIVYKAEAWSVT